MRKSYASDAHGKFGVRQRMKAWMILENRGGDLVIRRIGRERKRKNRVPLVQMMKTLIK